MFVTALFLYDLFVNCNFYVLIYFVNYNWVDTRWQ